MIFSFNRLAVFSIFRLDNTTYMRYNLSIDKTVENAVTVEGERIWRFIEPSKEVELIKGEVINDQQGIDKKEVDIPIDA